MQRQEQYNSGFIALQHSVQDATTKALHPLAKTIIIAMPGSTSNADWIDNWRLWSTDLNLPGWNGAIVHAGFMSGFRKIWGQVKGAVRRLSEMYPDYSIIVTGHSRAAPISVLTALFLIEELKPPLAKIEAWPIGSPRFVNLKFNQILLQKKIQVFSIQNEGDPVANLPPAWWGFHRVPREVLVTRRSLDLKTGKELPPYIRSSRAKTYICYDLFGLEDPRCIDQLSKEEDFDKHLRFRGWGVFGDVFFGYGTYQCNVPTWTDKLRKILNETGDFV
ncbi:Alpha/Beta hydrolase protein [Paraphysoderma sedebokerense]|nr:Alpha/Beta hydrolase protein [Paraphysoderma sedebokerense]